MTHARKGKVAHLPAAIRENINRMLYDGKTGKQIIAWLDQQEAHDVNGFGSDISDSNISQWRAGGYQDWLKSESQMEGIRKRAELSLRMAQAAGGSLAQSIVARIAGDIDEKLDGLSDEDMEKLQPILATVLEAEKMRLKAIEVEHKGEALDILKQRFQRETCVQFLAWFKDQAARDIAESAVSNEEKIEALRKRYYADVDAIEKGVELPK